MDMKTDLKPYKLRNFIKFAKNYSQIIRILLKISRAVGRNDLMNKGLRPIVAPPRWILLILLEGMT